MKIISKILIIAIPVIALVACSSTGTKTGQAGSSSGSASGGDGPDATTIGLSGDSGFDGATMEDIDKMLKTRVIYFDFNKSTIKNKYRIVVKAHAMHLANNPNATMTLEGHADERGSREYNVGLGERRADAIRRSMTLQGVSISQIDSVSFGEEKPAAFGHDEDSWSRNRRVEIIY